MALYALSLGPSDPMFWVVVGCIAVVAVPTLVAIWLDGKR